MDQNFITQILFIATTGLCLYFAMRAFKNNFLIFSYLIICLIAQALMANSGIFKADSEAKPPAVALAPAMMVIPFLLLLVYKKSRLFLLQSDFKFLIWIHIVRIPVEITLYLLYKQGLVPKLMTFEGSNPDILSGITAPIAFYMLYNKGNIKKIGLLIWNLACLGLLANIVIRAVLSVPSGFQQFAFDQPNLAVLQFPYVWLPGIVVPLVAFSHILMIAKILMM